MKFKEANETNEITKDLLLGKHSEAKDIIAEIDKYIQYAVDTSEYDVIKRTVEDWKVPEYDNTGVPPHIARRLEQRFERLEELYRDLK